MRATVRVPSVAKLRALFDEKVTRGIFNPVARFLRPDALEDRLQDAICQTWVMYRRYALDKRVVLPDAILVHSCRQRAVDPGRRFVPVDHQPKKDAYDERNYHEGHVELLHLDGTFWDDDDAIEADRQFLDLAEDMRGDPTGHILSAIDLEEWLATLTPTERRLLALKVEGFTLGEIAADLRLSVATVFARGRALGQELAARAGIAIGTSSVSVSTGARVPERRAGRSTSPESAVHA